MMLALAILGAAALGLLALLALRFPDLGIAAVVFLLYSNIAVVATRFHGVPKLAASGFVLLLAIPLARDLIFRRAGVIATPALPFLLLTLAVQTTGMIFSRNLEVSRTVVVEFITEGLLIYLLVTNTVRSQRSLRLALWALLLAGFVSAAVPIYQQATGSQKNDFGGFGQTSEVGFRTGELTSQGEVRQVRLAGPIGEQNRYAQNMLMLLPIGFCIVLGESTRRRRALALLLTLITALGFLLAFSRGGAVAFVIVFGAMMLMRVIAPRYAVLTCAAVVAGLLAMPQFWTRLETLREVPDILIGDSDAARTADSAITGRFTEMAAAALVFADHPVAGVGPGMFKYYSEEYGNKLGIHKLEGTRKAHSLYLEVAAEGGSLGIICFLGMVFITLYDLLAARRRLLGARGDSALGPRPAEDRLLESHVTGLLFALIAYLASGLFLHLSYIRFFYLILALGGAAASVARARISTPALAASTLAAPPSAEENRVRPD